MTLRLVLVSLVAAMGLTVPSAPVIESWVASTQNWMNAKFADWDARSPQTADYVIVNDYYDVVRFAPRPAITYPPATAPEPSERTGLTIASSASYACKPAAQQVSRSAAIPPVSLISKRTSFEPILVDEKLSLGVAYELNFKNEGIGQMPPEILRKPAAPVRFEPRSAVKKVYREVRLELTQWSRTLVSALSRVVFPASSHLGIEPKVVAKNPRGVVAHELIVLGHGIGINPPISGAPHPAVVGPARSAVVIPARQALASQTSFGPMETSASLYFAGELTPLAKRVIASRPMDPEQPSAGQVAVRMSLSAPATEFRGLPDDLDTEVAGELVWQDDGFGAAAQARMAPVIAATPRFDPLEVECDDYLGTAFELNFRNDGFNLPAEPDVHTTKTDPPAPQSAREISRAVKLTRDAVYAWVNIFTGPALVTVSQSN
jgi:hypothetical protein